MGHDVHFLMRLDRLSLPHVELAMSLYNDTPMVRFILDSLSLPEQVERIALSLDEEADGPVLVVHRDGHFITCLGAGMSRVGLEVVPRSRLDALSQRQQTLRERLELARQQKGPRGQAYSVFRPLLVSGACLSREEFIAASALAPLLQGEILNIILSLHKDLRIAAHDLRSQRRRRTAAPTLLRAYWDAVWGIGHLTLLLGMEGRSLWEAVSASRELEPSDVMISWPAVRQGLSPVALRGAWAAGKLGKLVLAGYKADYLRGGGSDLAYYSIVLSLFSIAGRHKGLRGEIRKAFQRGISTEERQACGFLFEKAPPLMLELYDMLMRQVEDDPRVLAVYAQSMYSKYMTPIFPAGSPHHYENPLDVPKELAIPAVAMLPFMLVGDCKALPIALALTTLISRLDAEALYFPRSFLQTFNFQFRPKLVTALLEKEEELYGPREPVTAEPRPGRNAPCPCGTGKKYKKCCAQIEA